MRTIKQSYVINAPLEHVWNAFVDPKIIKQWSGGPAKMSEEEGKVFQLWGGDIHGTNLTVNKPNKLVQEWYSADAPGHKTKVTFTFSQKAEKTHVELFHELVKEENYDDLAAGWKDYYMEPLKKLVEDQI